MISRIASSTQTANQESVAWTIFYIKEEPNEAVLVKKIYDIIQAAVNKPHCKTCFKAANATPVIEQDGLVIVTESVFTDARHDSEWTSSKEVAEKLRKTFNRAKTLFTRIVTTNDITLQGGYQGKRYIGLTKRGINEIDDHFSVTLIHALLHSGRVEGNENQGSGFHDLVHLGKKYDDVIEACQDNKSRVGKSAGKGENGQ